MPVLTQACHCLVAFVPFVESLVDFSSQIITPSCLIYHIEKKRVKNI